MTTDEEGMTTMMFATRDEGYQEIVSVLERSDAVVDAEDEFYIGEIADRVLVWDASAQAFTMTGDTEFFWSVVAESAW